MMIDSLIEKCNRLGIRLTLTGEGGDRLQVDAPKDALSASLREALSANKTDLVARLKSQQLQSNPLPAPTEVSPEAPETEALISQSSEAKDLIEIPPVSTPVQFERVDVEMKKLLAGEDYDVSVIDAKDWATRQLIAASLLAALTSRNFDQHERARKAFLDCGYFDEATRDLRSADSPTERTAAAQKLGSTSSQATTHLIAALYDTAPEVRRAAVESLGQIGDPAAVSALEDLLLRENSRQLPEAVIRHAINSISVSQAKHSPTVERPTLRIVEKQTEDAITHADERKEFFHYVDRLKLREFDSTAVSASQDAEKDLAAEEERLRLEEEALLEAAAELEQKRLAAEGARKKAEEEARLNAEMEAQVKAELEAREQEEQEARRRAEETAARRRAEEESRLRAGQEALRRAEEEASLRAKEEARFRIEAETLRKAAEELALRRAEAENARKLAEEEARRLAEEQARRRAAEEARRAAEDEMRRRLEEEARRLAEEEARRAAEAEMRRKLEEEARQRAQEEARQQAAEAELRRKLEEEARQRAEEEARRQAAEEARRAAEAEMRRKLEEEARQRAEEAWRIAEEVRLRAEEEARRTAEERIRLRAAAEALRLTEEERLLHEAERRRHEEEERLRVEQEALMMAAADLARRRAEIEATRKRKEEEAQSLAETQERLRVEEEEARRQVQEERLRLESEAQLRIEEERRRLEEARRWAVEQQREIEEHARRQAEEEEGRLMELEALRRKSEEEGRRRTEQEQRIRAEIEALRKAEEEQRMRIETETRRRAEVEARLTEEQALQQAQEAARLQAEEEASRLAEEARQRADEEARRRTEIEVRLKEEQARQHALEAARLQAEEEARRLAEEAHLRVDQEARHRAEVEALLRHEAERRHAEEAARLKAEQEVSRLAEEARLWAEEERRRAEEATRLKEEEEQRARAAAIAFEDTTDAESTGGDIPSIEMPWAEIEFVHHEGEPQSTESSLLEDESLIKGHDSEEPAQFSLQPEVAIEGVLEPEAGAETSITTSDAVKDIDIAHVEKGIAQAGEDSRIPADLRHRLYSQESTERASALTDLARIGGDESFRNISKAFDDQSADVRNAAARALYDLQSDRAASFTRALREGTPERRRRIGAALAASGLASNAVSNLTGESREKTYDAFSLLFLMAKAGEVQPLMRAIEEHGNIEVRLAVVKLLALSGQPEIVPAFRRLAVRGSLPSEVRSAVMEAIYQISSQSRESTPSAA